MCDNCQGYEKFEPIEHIYQYQNLMRQIDDLIADRRLILTTDLDLWRNLLSDPRGSRPDVVVHSLECPWCRSIFELGADFYHGRASWRLTLDRAINFGKG
jgi:hypothetical protein